MKYFTQLTIIMYEYVYDSMTKTSKKRIKNNDMN